MITFVAQSSKPIAPIDRSFSHSDFADRDPTTPSPDNFGTFSDSDDERLNQMERGYEIRAIRDGHGDDSRMHAAAYVGGQHSDSDESVGSEVREIRERSEQMNQDGRVD